MKNFKHLLLVFAFLTSALAFGQGVTTASIGGKVTDAKGESLPGATIVAVHVPTGTTYGNTSDFDGFFRISNMRVGGPYKITISYIGFKSYVEQGVRLNLGQTKRFTVKLEEEANQLDEIVITSTTDGLIDGNKTGAATTIGLEKINTVPTASRSLADFVRLTPTVQISEGNDGFSISIAGQNNRYNAIYIDGAVNNDVFGLAGSGTNGGQTGVNPFSIDAIEELQVNVAPFDVKIGGFTGGAINAITRSGTNKWEASAFSFFRNENLAGKTPTELNAPTRERLDEFSSLYYGVRAGGPIIKDKLFLFVLYERQEEEFPLPFDIADYNGDSDLAEVNRLRDFVNTAYGYDIGGFSNPIRTLNSDKITTRLDWNVNEKNKVMLRMSYVEADNLETRSSSPNRLGFENGSESFLDKTLSTTLEWNYQGNSIANNLLIGYTSNNADRDPAGSPFPTVIIGDGLNVFRSQGLVFGAEPFSTANGLETEVLTITNNFQIFSGRHTITLGTHNEFTRVKNLFFAFNFGQYRYNSVDDFINNVNLRDYDRAYSLLSPGAGDSSSGAAEFNTKQFGFYVQDEVDLTDNFKFTAGVRVDIPVWEDGIANEDFNTRSVGIFGDALRGARVGQGIDTRMYLAPRVGFNWNVNGENKTQIRGGFGIFTSRLPFVWPGGTYNNNGVTGGFYSDTELLDGTPITFNPDVNNQPVGAVPGTGQTGGNVDLFAPDFRLPQVTKWNLAIDQRLPAGFNVSADFLYQSNLNAIFYEGLNIDGPIGRLNGADNRLIWNDSRSARPDGAYERIILASNTSEGDSWNASATLTHNLRADKFSLQSSATYSYGDSRSIFDGTSSQNSSQWRNIYTVDGKNTARIATSDFAQGHRVFANFTASYEWNEHFKTTIGLLYDGTQGQPFSYGYSGQGLLNDDSRDNALFYVPANASEINLVDITDNNGNVLFTAAQQWEALDEYISNNAYLDGRRGGYTQRNGDRGLWSHQLDLKFIQDFSIVIGENRHSLQFTADIFNFGNLLNKDWGTRWISIDTDVAEVVGGGGTANPEFQFDPRFTPISNIVDDRGIQSSRWQAQIGLRYIFD